MYVCRYVRMYVCMHVLVYIHVLYKCRIPKFAYMYVTCEYTPLQEGA